MKEFRDALTSNTLSYLEKCSRAKLEKAIYEFLQSKQLYFKLQGVAWDKKRRRLPYNKTETAGLSQPVNSLGVPFSKQCLRSVVKIAS